MGAIVYWVLTSDSSELSRVFRSTTRPWTTRSDSDITSARLGIGPQTSTIDPADPPSRLALSTRLCPITGDTFIAREITNAAALTFISCPPMLDGVAWFDGSSQD